MDKNLTEDKPVLQRILDERELSYGKYKHVAYLVEQATKLLLTHNIHKSHSQYSHDHTIKMILVKLARLINGDPNHLDSWLDIQGYCQLIINEIENKEV